MRARPMIYTSHTLEAREEGKKAGKEWNGQEKQLLPGWAFFDISVRHELKAAFHFLSRILLLVRIQIPSRALELTRVLAPLASNLVSR